MTYYVSRETLHPTHPSPVGNTTTVVLLISWWFWQ